MTDSLNLEEYAVAAEAVLPPAVYDFIRGGAGDEVTLRGNRAAFDRWRLVPRVLGGIRECTLATTVLGQEVAFPVLVAPMGLHRMAHEEGELASARAARRAGTILAVSTAASWTLEEIGDLAGPWWFQLYILRDRGLTEELVRRAEAAGATGLIVTVDVTVRGRREANERNRFEIPDGVTMPNLIRPEILGAGEGQLAATYANLTGWEPTIGWRDIDWLVSLTTLPVLIKGVLHPEDARLALAQGARGVIVSNHGGRQLDGAVASLDALPAIVEAVAGRGEVLLDGGVRRGTDVLKALALGARAVMIGRPFLFGLAVGGEEGAARVLELLRAELALDLLLCGRASVAAVDRSLLVSTDSTAR